MGKAALLVLVGLIGNFVLTNAHEGKIWALLVAGSNEYYNYRHQADVCHAYHVIKSHGVPDENIVVMMYDDIAKNPENPTPGVILNQPHGKNVYEGVPKDYTGEAVTPQNFLHVLKGNSEKMHGIGSGKVINSTEEDHIFVFYSDHGGPGILGMVEEELYAADLHKTVQEMFSNNQFSKMVMLIEACHAGSMFDEILEDNTNVFVITAADPFESSYACCYSNKYDTYLGDAFSVNWMNLVEDGDVTASSSLHKLFTKLRTATEDSHVEEYGDLNLGTEELSEFIGHGNMTKHHPFHHHQPFVNGPFKHGPFKQVRLPRSLENLFVPSEQEFEDYVPPVNHDKTCKETVPSLDVPIHLLKKKADRSTTSEERKFYDDQIQNILQKRVLVDQTIEHIIKEAFSNIDGTPIEDPDLVSYKINKENMHCAKAVTSSFSENCFKISKNPFVRGVLHNLIKTCNTPRLNSEAVTKIIEKVCSGFPKYNGIV